MPTFAKFHGSSVQGAGKGNMEKTLCRTCGKRHMIGKCPLGFKAVRSLVPGKEREYHLEEVKPSLPIIKLGRLEAEITASLGPDPVTKPLTKGPKSVTQETTVTKAVTERSRPFNHKVKHCPTCTCQRVYASKAEKQRAYRKRKSSLAGRSDGENSGG